MLRLLTEKKSGTLKQLQQQSKDPRQNLKGLAKEIEKYAHKSGRTKEATAVLSVLLFTVLAYDTIMKEMVLREWFARQFKHSSYPLPGWSDDWWDPKHELDENYQRILDQVMEDMKIRMYKKENFLVFFTDHLSVYCLKYNNPFNAVGSKGTLGLPYYSSFSSVEDVDFTQLKHKTAYTPLKDPIQIDLSTYEAEDDELKATFVLSDNARKFLLATQSYEMGSTLTMAAKGGAKAMFLMVYTLFSSSLNSSLGLFRHPLYLRLGVYSLCFSSLGLFSILLSVRFRRMVDEAVDQMACQLGPDYAEGGVEFYSKAIKRAKLMRMRDIPGAEEYFNDDGDLIKDRGEKFPELCLKKRLACCEKVLQRQKKGLVSEFSLYAHALKLEIQVQK